MRENIIQEIIMNISSKNLNIVLILLFLSLKIFVLQISPMN